MAFKTWLLGAALALASTAYAEDQEFIFGACTHRESVPGYLNVLSQTGVDYLRDHATWGRSEDEKGKPFLPQYYVDFVDKASSFKIKSLNILCYSNKFYDGGGYPKSPEAVEAYARYAETLVSGLKGKCRLYQVWNEWDGGCGMKGFAGQGTPKSYMTLLKATYPRIKAADPSAVVISNSVCTGDKFLKDLLKLDLLKHCDAIGFHTYNFAKERTPEKWYERMQGVDQFVKEANGGKEFPLYITEMGWPTHAHAKRGSTEDYSADCMSRLYLLGMSMSFIKGIWWYEFRDGGYADCKEQEENFGMVRPDLTPKRSFFVMRDLTGLFKGAKFIERIDAKDPEIWLLKYKAKDGSDLIAAWSTKEDEDAFLRFSIPSSTAPACKVTWLGYGPVSTSFFKESEKDARAKLTLTVRSRPYVLSGKLDGLSFDGFKLIKFPISELIPKKVIFGVPAQIAKASPADAQGSPYGFGEDRNYRCVIENTKWGGKADLDASFSVRWSPKAIFIDVEVSDDKFSQEFKEQSTWQGDGLQMAFHALGGAPELERDLKHVDIDVALTKDGAKAYRQYVLGDLPQGPADDIKVQAETKGSKTVYKIEVPVSSVGLPELKKGSIFGFSLLVNDNDGNGRKGYLHWGDGIGNSKDPAQYNWIIAE